MQIYLDDDSVKKSLVVILRKGGHVAVTPAEVALIGRPDPVHLLHALNHDLVLLTRNYRDYPDLHDLVLGSGGHHGGIMLVRQDNDPTRDMTDRQIITAIGKLERAGQMLADKLVVLNQWR